MQHSKAPNKVKIFELGVHFWLRDIKRGLIYLADLDFRLLINYGRILTLESTQVSSRIQILFSAALFPQ